ncbi:hypothetical protein EV424DRAFT_1544059 [Suillus variegatus]|nr:hypothetical protein EV424DRAFT_1544059 [Suillus variegatus]
MREILPTTQTNGLTPHYLAMRAITTRSLVHNDSPGLTTSICIAEPTVARSVSTEACSTSIGAYSAAVQHKCETWLREQDPDFTPVRQLFSDKYGYSNCITHLEQRMPVIVHSIDSSFHLSSTWVPPGVQEAFDKACHLELRSQTGLVATYLDMEGYHSHQRNPELELYHLHVKMCRAKAEVEVYELAIGNAPASDYSDSDASSSLGSRP